MLVWYRDQILLNGTDCSNTAYECCPGDRTDTAREEGEELLMDDGFNGVCLWRLPSTRTQSSATGLNSESGSWKPEGGSCSGGTPELLARLTRQNQCRSIARRGNVVAIAG